MKWDKNRCRIAKLSNNDCTATNQSDWSYAAFIGTHSVTRYSVKIDRYRDNGYVMIGLAPTEKFVNNKGYQEQCGYYLCSNGSYCISSLGLYGGTVVPIRDGSIVTTVYNTKNDQVSFIIDGSDCGVAFDNVTGQLYPSIVLGHTFSVTIVSE